MQNEAKENVLDDARDHETAWDKDQKRRYYYDDAHGYETYEQAEEDDSSDAIVTIEPGGINEK